MAWQLADAKNRFSEVVTRALNEGPQRVRRRGQTVVILAEEEYDRLTGEKPGLVDYLMSGPSFEGVDLERDQSLMRDVKF
jgi:prevent-host-death family protein